MKLPQLPQDQANHYIYGSIAAVVGAYIAQAFGVDRWLGAVAFAAALGFAKEAYDRLSKKGTPDLNDAIVTAAGALPVVLVL
jgi:hypothetical protein